jgi:SHS2 domain-containing protein
MRASHEWKEHVGEVALSLRGETLEALFAEAGRALAELMIDESSRDRRPAELAAPVEVRAPDRTALLIGWLNELIFLAETERTVLTDFDIRAISEHEVIARARGIAEPTMKTAVKAATFHDASVAAEAGGYRARVVLDV